jgi:phenylalanyl-tRNA synthetase beta chain
MKFSENWLRTFVNPDLTSDQLGHQLTMAGLEVEALDAVAPAFEKVVIGEVLSLDKHPDADRLQVCQVSIGTGAPLQIVCGAKNVHVGARVPCALVGAQLPAMTIKQAKVRGVESSGMLCSEQELGLAEAAEGLLLLPADAPVGADIRTYLDLDDKLFTLKLTPNRSDCLSVAGIAREVAAVTASSLTFPKIAASPQTVSDQFSVTVEEGQACPRYCGRIIRGVNLAAQTPVWMTRRLERSGLRCINPVVDVTNYVLLELGQPLHAFDLHKLQDAITVRFARAGEKLSLLNEQEISLAPDLLVIADASGPVALAGIMGGLGSAVSDGCHDIFLESAFFTPEVIAGKGRRLGIATDSSFRFERGVDFSATRDALERATELIREICGGEAGPITEVAGELPQREPIKLRADRARRVVGINFDAAQIEELLFRLQMSFVCDHGTYFVVPPSYRFDLSIEEDLIEELARLYGYDHIPAVAPHAALTMLAQPEAVRDAMALRHLLVARDYQEVINYSFVDAGWEQDFSGRDAPIALKNPIASQMSVMRSTLCGGLIDNLRYNLNRKQERVRLFEVGRAFYQVAGELQQPYKLAGLCYGASKPEQWGEAARPVDFFDVKSDLEALFWPQVAVFKAAPHPALHPGQAAEIRFGDKVVGWLGVLHPNWQQKYEFPVAPVLFELDLAALTHVPVPAYADVPKFPAVRRDLAIVVDEGLALQTLLDGLREAQPGIVSDIALFDVYRGQGVDFGKKSLALRMLMQDTQKTLTDAEVDSTVAQVTQLLEVRFNAKLRN